MKKMTSLMVDEELWKRAKMYAIENNMSLREFIETIVRRELEERRLIKERVEG
ncbi:MAG: hypothetical protein ACTSPB_16645 [Candidatus Thorarchaeota archaeon]